MYVVAPERSPVREAFPPSPTRPAASGRLDEPETSIAISDNELVAPLQDQFARLEDELEALRSELQSERDRASELQREVQRLELEARVDRAPGAGDLDMSAEDSGESRLACLQRIDTAG